jgi:phage-related protein
MPKGKGVIVLYEGNFHSIELAVTMDGECPAKEFLDSLPVEKRAQIIRIIKRLADFGKIHHREQFKKIEDDFYEFKYYQIRMPCFFMPNQRVVITHGFIKKGDHIGEGQILRMKRIRREYVGK